jgi:hypothetical protein
MTKKPAPDRDPGAFRRRRTSGGSNIPATSINPNAYLTDVLTRIVTKRDGDTLNDLLPHKWINTNRDGYMFEYNTMPIAA